MKLELQDIALWMGAELRQHADGQAGQRATGYSIDTRTLRRAICFLPSAVSVMTLMTLWPPHSSAVLAQQWLPAAK